jgi:RNA polymerase sigma-70 factor (ECF subfamily)
MAAHAAAARLAPDAGFAVFTRLVPSRRAARLDLVMHGAIVLALGIAAAAWLPQAGRCDRVAGCHRGADLMAPSHARQHGGIPPPTYFGRRRMVACATGPAGSAGSSAAERADTLASGLCQCARTVFRSGTSSRPIDKCGVVVRQYVGRRLAPPADLRGAVGAVPRGGPMSEREADAILVERVQRGDKHAFELLVVKYQRKILRLLSRLIRDPSEIEDVAQEAFIKAYRALPQFRGDSAFYTWLYRIAINTAKNHLVASGRRPSSPSEFETEDGETFDETDTLSDNNTPESVLASREIAETVNAAIEALPEELRSAIVLREIEGMSYEDIAVAMGCPIGTVRSRIFRAREAIASRLKPLLGNNDDRRW